MDKFIFNEFNEKDYKKKIKLEKEKKKESRQQIYVPKPLKRDVFYYKDQEIKHKTYGEDMKFQNDFFHIKEKGDNVLNKWIMQQKEPIIIFLSEFIPGTKVSKEIENFRPIIKTTPTISIEEYRKKKKIGEEGVEYLKRLRDKYGVIVLKVLWANLNF